MATRLQRSDPTAPRLPAWRQQRFVTLQREIEGVLREAYRTAATEHATTLETVARAEAAHTVALLETAFPDAASVGGLNEARLRVLLDELLLGGAPAPEWWARQAGTWGQQVQDVLRQGMALSETLAELVARVRALTGMRVRDAEALVRTALTTVANKTRLAVYERNSDVVSGVQWLTTLDTRACLRCIPLSALVWDM